MKSRAVALLLVILISLPLVAQKAKSASTPAPSSKAQIKRGEYLVNDAVQCGDCHSPRNEKGEYIRSMWLMGSPLFFKPTVPMPDWAEVAPPIAGLFGWSDEQAIRFFTTGIRPSGVPARIPMPAFRFSREDAAAVTAYLKSLGTQTAGKQESKEPKE